jgi:hypothetical protein
MGVARLPGVFRMNRERGMRFFPVLACLLFSVPLWAQSPAEELTAVKSVYVQHMGNAFDQYLVTHLTESGLFRVVTHPKDADAVFTDRFGKSLENWLDELTAPPKPEKEETKDSGVIGSTSYDPRKESVNPESTFGRGKGNYYLVSPKTKTVLWSIYLPAKSTAPKDQNAAAAKLVKELKSHLKQLQKQ